MQKNIAVIILNYARWPDTLICAESVLAGQERPAHIILVDNDSPDDSAQNMRGWLVARGRGVLPCVMDCSDSAVRRAESLTVGPMKFSLLCMKHNNGYAAGNNAGIRLALRDGADACWLLNNDTIVSETALHAMSARLFAEDAPGLCGSLLLYANEEDRVQCCGGGYTNIWTFLSRLQGADLGLAQAQQLDAAQIERSINFIYGASLMASRRFCEAVGPMDESFFLYCEEQDWAWRGMRKGFKLAYAPAAIVRHKEGLTSGMNYRQKNFKRQWLLIRSRLKATLKHHPYALPSVAAGCCYAAVRQIARKARALSDKPATACLFLKSRITASAPFRKLAMLMDKVRRNFFPYCKKILILLSLRKDIRAAYRQRRASLAQTPQAGKDVVLLVVPPSLLRISGGLFSILNIASVSRQLLGEEREVVAAHLPGAIGLAQYPYFPNDEIIYTFSQILRRYPTPERLLVHIPECCASRIFTNQNSPETQYIRSAKHVHINILNQNIQLMPPPDALKHLHALTPNVTQTTAHATYCNQANANKWGTPQLHLSAVFWKEYPFVPYSQKQDWIAYSPDPNPFARDILAALRARLPHFRLIKISGVSYKRYLEIISRSKYVLSFGEGWDGYFFEPYYCGTLGCTARNDIFFPKEMGCWETLYDSFEHMREMLPVDIQKYEKNPDAYQAYSMRKYNELQSSLESAWGYFTGQLKKLYDDKYDYYPE